jgi:hypothetical protein
MVLRKICYNNLVSFQHNLALTVNLFPVGVSALSTVTVKPWTLEGDGG